MPTILIRDYSWRQTTDEVIISVQLSGKPRKVDVLAIANYVKVSFPPFFLELFLWEEITENESKCSLTEELAIFTLKKCQAGENWPSLTLEKLSSDKKRELRNRALELLHSLEKKKKQEIGDKRQLLQRQAVREQIEWDTRIHNQIQESRDKQRREAMREFENWRQKAEMPMFQDVNGIIQENRKEYTSPISWFKRSSASKTTLKTPSISNFIDETTKIHKKTPAEDFEDAEESSESWKIECSKDAEQGKKIIEKILKGDYPRSNKTLFDNSKPAPRQNGKIDVTFSKRIFPTPARESSHLEEQEWLEKQAEARRKCGFATEDLTEEEQNPQWLKDKGDDFFKVGNYLAAVSAYTHGIKLSKSMSSLYANRAAAQYALGNYQRCAEDCSKALELMVPKCEGNRHSRARCHARLGAALCKLSAPQHGIPELEAALKLSPGNSSIRRDLEEANNYFKLSHNNE